MSMVPFLSRYLVKMLAYEVNIHIYIYIYIYIYPAFTVVQCWYPANAESNATSQHEAILWWVSEVKN